MSWFNFTKYIKACLTSSATKPHFSYRANTLYIVSILVQNIKGTVDSSLAVFSYDLNKIHLTLQRATIYNILLGAATEQKKKKKKNKLSLISRSSRRRGILNYPLISDIYQTNEFTPQVPNFESYSQSYLLNAIVYVSKTTLAVIVAC